MGCHDSSAVPLCRRLAVGFRQRAAGGRNREAPEEPKPIFARQGRFSIPFRVDAPAEVAPPAKVRLFVSEDGGTRWHLDAEVPPSQQRFDFRSLHDGEYWFTIRSIDAQGRSYPDGAYEPQLRVIVDTLAPRLEFRPCAEPAAR